jgi:electron transfer flavoprotein alpha subunit
MKTSILIFAEQRNRKVRRSSLEVLSQGCRIGQKLDMEISAIIIGYNVRSLAETLGHYGANKVFVVDEPRFERYLPEGYARAVVEVVGQVNPKAILFSASSMGKDLAPTVATMLSTSVAADCIGLSVENENLIFTRPVYAGKAYLTLRVEKAPAVATLRPNVFVMDKPDETRKTQIEEIKLTLDVSDLRSLVKEIVEISAGNVDLTEAQIVVSGGRGMRSAENFRLIEELASVLGAAVGASRAAVDAGWRPQRDQVGQTGKTVSPNLYIACGISGAIQHLAGMSRSKVIVAINKDHDAPIFNVANYGIVGDIFEVIPAMIEQIKKTI